MRTIDQTMPPELDDTIQTLIEANLVNLNVCLPAKIVSYDKDTQSATVQIQLLQKYEDGAIEPRAPIPNVPVIHPRANAGAAFVHMPLKKGDDVTLVFSQRSLDNWKGAGGMQDPADRRKFHITDAFALIGGSAFPDAFTPSTDDCIEIVNGSLKLIIPAQTVSFRRKNDTKLRTDSGAQRHHRKSRGHELQTLSEDIGQHVFPERLFLNSIARRIRNKL